MDYPKENSRSLYDYSDKSVRHAGYAAIAYASVNLFTGVLALIQHFIYQRHHRGHFWRSRLLYLSSQSRRGCRDARFRCRAPAFYMVRRSFSGGHTAQYHCCRFFCFAAPDVYFRITQSVSLMPRKRSNQAMPLTASKLAIYAGGVCRRERILRGMHRGLAAADLVSR